MNVAPIFQVLNFFSGEVKRSMTHTVECATDRRVAGLYRGVESCIRAHLFTELMKLKRVRELLRLEFCT